MKGGQHQTNCPGFTLLEVLAAVAVFSILILLMAQIINGSANTANMSEIRTDAESQARLVFATMGNDFAHMIQRTDADAQFIKLGSSGSPANDAFFFYTEAPGAYDSTITTTSKSPYSVAGYWIDSNTGDSNPFQLQRFDKGLTWDTGTVTPVSLPATGPPVFGTMLLTSTLMGPVPLTNCFAGEVYNGAGNPTTTTNYSVLGDGVFRMEFCFLRTDGTYSDSPYISIPSHAFGLQDVSAIVVAIAILDSKNQKILGTSPAVALSSFVSLFADSGYTSISNGTAATGIATQAGAKQPTGGLMATQWQSFINSSTYISDVQADGLPVAAARQVRVFQHTFYLNKL